MSSTAGGKRTAAMANVSYADYSDHEDFGGDDTVMYNNVPGHHQNHNNFNISQQFIDFQTLPQPAVRKYLDRIQQAPSLSQLAPSDASKQPFSQDTGRRSNRKPLSPSGSDAPSLSPSSTSMPSFVSMIKLPPNFYAAASSHYLDTYQPSIPVYQQSNTSKKHKSQAIPKESSSASFSHSHLTSDNDGSVVTKSDRIQCQDHYRKLEVNEKEVLPWFVYLMRNKDKLLKVPPHELNVYTSTTSNDISQQQPHENEQKQDLSEKKQGSSNISSTALKDDGNAMDTTLHSTSV